jgi:hypothetical protein
LVAGSGRRSSRRPDYTGHVSVCWHRRPRDPSALCSVRCSRVSRGAWASRSGVCRVNRLAMAAIVPASAARAITSGLG